MGHQTLINAVAADDEDLRLSASQSSNGCAAFMVVSANNFAIRHRVGGAEYAVGLREESDVWPRICSSRYGHEFAAADLT